MLRALAFWLTETTRLSRAATKDAERKWNFIIHLVASPQNWRVGYHPRSSVFRASNHGFMARVNKDLYGEKRRIRSCSPHVAECQRWLKTTTSQSVALDAFVR